MGNTKSGKKAARPPAKGKSKQPVNGRKAAASTKTPAKTASASVGSPRHLKPPRYRVFHRKKYRPTPVKVISAWKITKKATVLLRTNWKVIGGIVLVYGLLNLLLRGLGGGLDVSQLKHDFDLFSHGIGGHISTGLSIFVLLLTSSNSNSAASAGSYQTFLVLLASLVLVWTFRQVLAGKHVRIRDGFYSGTYPLVPVLLVLLVVGFQLIPFMVGGWLLGSVIQNGLAASAWEEALWIAVFIIGACISVYMICSSMFALYIATLEGMTPIRALKNARKLVKYRRWSIIRKLVYLPIFLLIVTALIMLPIIWFVPVLAQWVFLGLTMLLLPVVHAYLYTFYRELLA